MEGITAELKAFIGTIGAIIAAGFGIVSRHVHAEGGFLWSKVFREVPVAIFVGICVTGVGEYLDVNDLITNGLAAGLAYLSPPVLVNLFDQFITQKLGLNDADTDGK